MLLLCTLQLKLNRQGYRPYRWLRRYAAAILRGEKTATYFHGVKALTIFMQLRYQRQESRNDLMGDGSIFSRGEQIMGSGDKRPQRGSGGGTPVRSGGS